jgi:hypothetical protein
MPHSRVPRGQGLLQIRAMNFQVLVPRDSSIGLHALGVFSGGDWNGHPFVDWHYERLWSWSDNPLVYYSNIGILDAYAKVKRRLLALPTSRDAPHKLAASYRLTSLAPEITLHTRDFLLCHISVVNTGGEVWLDRAQWEKGEVRLRSRYRSITHTRAGDVPILSILGRVSAHPQRSETE